MNFLQTLAQQFSGKPIDWDDLEEALIRADLGVPMTMRIIKTLQEREAWALLGIGDVIKAVRAEVARILPSPPTLTHRANGKPTVMPKAPRRMFLRLASLVATEVICRLLT